MFETGAEAVAAAAAVLDEHDPGWWDRINTDTLRIHDPAVCVLGQLYRWDSGRALLAQWVRDGVYHFASWECVSAFASHRATPLWLEEIAARRETAPTRERPRELAATA